jgi:predicted DNA-binding transcriptional regulator YafY
MGNKTNTENWNARERLMHIERLAYWRGWVRRTDLCSRFEISIPQASADLGAYIRLNPSALHYDRISKRYLAANEMVCKLKAPAFEDALSFISNSTPFSPAEEPVARIDLPSRHIPVEAARNLIRAISSKLSLEIYYFSIHSGTERWRRITPHALAHDGYRWHTRAWCHEDQDYKDFVLGRIAKTRSLLDAGSPVKPDVGWTTWVKLQFRPHHRLDAVQRKAIEHDYAMKNGCAMLRVRKAMLDYTLAYLRLLPDSPSAEQRHLELIAQTIQKHTGTSNKHD